MKPAWLTHLRCRPGVASLAASEITTSCSTPKKFGGAATLKGTTVARCRQRRAGRAPRLGSR